MNILILNWRDTKHPLGGGAEISLLEHASYWVKNGAQVTWFTSSFPNARKQEQIHGITIIRRGSMFTVHIYAFFYFLWHLKGSTDIILDNFHFIPFFSPLYAGKTKVVAFINEPAKNAWFKNINIIIGIVGYIFEPLFFLPYRSVPFLTGSESIAKELPRYFIHKNNIYVIHHGVTVKQLTHFPRKAKNPVIIYLAQLAPDKGIEDALQMFEIVSKTVPTSEFWIVGKAQNQSYLEKISQLVDKISQNGRITMHGYVSEEKKFTLLERAWVLVHPSLREGWGLNVIEANAFGTPAVGYNIAGLQDSIRDQQTGILTKKNTPLELAKEVKVLLQDRKKYANLSKQAMEFAKQFSWDASGEKSLAILKSVYESTSKR